MNGLTQARFSRLLPLLLFILLFLAAWLPRVSQIDSFVTPDERRWLQRSANFLFALDKGDYAATYQAGHPGVTIMWAGAAGILANLPDYPEQVKRPLDEDGFDSWIRANTNVPLLQLLVAGRYWIVLAISLVIALTFLPLRTLFGTTAAFVATLFVAWDPFYVGLSRQLHPDGLVATLVLFALAAFFAWLYDRQRLVWLIIAGLTTGLAVLTKSPALVAPFVMVILTVVEWLRARNNPARRRTLFLGLLQFGLYSAIAFVAFWPATWSGPRDAFVRMLSLAVEFSEQGHELPLYFWGHTIADPGPLFYPVNLLMRVTPAVLLGLICALVTLWRGWYPINTPKAKQALLALLAFALVYLFIITFAEKKMDRYLLPAMPVLAVVAGMGWVGIAAAIRRALPTQRWATVAGVTTVAVALLLLHAIFSVLNYPYYLTYYNPLFGGSRTAPQVMMIGWGEGLDQAAHWINQQPTTARPRHRVVSWYGSGPLSYYLDPTVSVLPFYAGGETTEEWWFDADYAILYVNQWQRENPSQELMDFFLSHKPALKVSFAGLDLVYVYALRDLQPPDGTHLHRIAPALWDNKIELDGYLLKDTTIFPGDKVPLALYWRGAKPMDQDYKLDFRLLDATGKALWSNTRSPAGIETSDWPVDKLWRDSYTLKVPPDLPPGSYQLAASFHAPNGDLLPLTDKGQPDAKGELVVATLNVAQPTQIDDFSAEWPGAKLNSIAHVPTVVAGSSLFVDTNATVTTTTPLKLSLRLLDKNGGTVAQDDQGLQPTSRYRLLIPDGTSPGPYTLAAVLYDPSTLAAIPDQDGAESVNLSQVEVK